MSLKIFGVFLVAMLLTSLASAQAVDCKITPNPIRAHVNEQIRLYITCYDEQHQTISCPTLQWFSDSAAVKLRPLGSPDGAIFYFKYYVWKAKVTARPYYNPTFGCSVSAYGVASPIRGVNTFVAPTRVPAKKVVR
jgi:hypothetical protein